MVRKTIDLALFTVVVLGLSACASTPPDQEIPDFGISGIYESEVSYSDDLPTAERGKIFGIDPDLEFTVIQTDDKIKGEFTGDRDGTITRGKVDDNEVTFEFVLEAKGGELKEGEGTWIIQEDGSLKGDFKVRERQLGIVRGLWTLTPTD